jgi:MFS family permease
MPAPTSPTQAATGKTGRGRPFWFSMTALAFTVLLSALDLTAVSTALPTIAADLDGGDSFVWVGSAYALASTAFLPLSGALADIFGRRPVLLISIGFFALGSALAGAAQNMDMMIAARSKPKKNHFLRPSSSNSSSILIAIQGIGGGGILNLTEIVVSDLVPLAERGIFQGFFGMIWAFASGVGPTVVSSIIDDYKLR